MAEYERHSRFSTLPAPKRNGAYENRIEFFREKKITERTERVGKMYYNEHWK